MNTINVENCKTLLIGRRGENEVTTVAFDFAEWQTEFGSGVVDLYVKRFGDNSAYPVVLTIDGTIATWTVTATDTNVAGYGKAEYVYRVDGKIAKSAVVPFFVAEDIGQPASEPPDPYESWLEQLTALGAETEAHAQAAEQSAENAAESAENAAQSAASAEGYAGQAETAAGLAQAAQTASEAARDSAQTAQASAESSATAASGSAASAAGSATAAAGSASDASASATSAGASATTASTAATQAEAAKTAAQTAQSAAEDAAEDAQQAAQQAHVEYEQLSGEVDDLSDEVAQQKSAIEDLEALTNRKAGMLVDSVSGAVASFVPDSTIDNLLGVSVDIEPVQDLHGYDSPWPAGGGANKFDGEMTSGSIYADTGIEAPYPNSSTWFSTNFIPVDPAKSYYAVADGSTTSPTLRGRFYDANKDYIGYVDSLGRQLSFRTPFSPPANAAYMKIVPNKSDVPMTSKVAVNDPATVTTYSPYSNICPISGWDAVGIQTAGKNLLENTATSATVSGVTFTVNEDGTVTVNGTATATVFYNISVQTLVFDEAVIVSGCPAGGSGPTYSLQINNLTLETGNGVTIQSGTAITNVRIRIASGTTCTNLLYKPMICAASESTAMDYKPYAGDRYTIALGQTVYGCTLDATAGTLTVDRAKRHFSGGNDAWVVGVGAGVNCNRAAFQFSNALLGSNNGIVSDVFKSELRSTPKLYHGMVNNNGSLLLGVPTTVADRAAMNSWAAENPFDIVYYIAPIEIQLDPVTIAAIAGQTNNVWADAGDVDVTFAADVKTYIDRLNQPTEDDMIANSLIAANKYFTVNNRLFLSTASIAAGAMIIPGTNCQETSLAAALNALNT